MAAYILDDDPGDDLDEDDDSEAEDDFDEDDEDEDEDEDVETWQVLKVRLSLTSGLELPMLAPISQLVTAGDTRPASRHVGVYSSQAPVTG